MSISPPIPGRPHLVFFIAHHCFPQCREGHDRIRLTDGLLKKLMHNLDLTLTEGLQAFHDGLSGRRQKLLLLTLSLVKGVLPLIIGVRRLVWLLRSK
jgi:hypothetical protein